MPPLSKQIHERYIIIRYSTKKQKRREPTGYSLIRASPENRKKNNFLAICLGDPRFQVHQH